MDHIRWSWLFTAIFILTGCQSTPSKHGADSASSMQVVSEPAPPPALGPNRWTEISCRGTHQLETGETAYALTFQGQVGRQPDLILMNRPNFELTRVIDQDGRDLADPQPRSSRSSRYYMRWDAQLLQWFEGRNRGVDGPILDISLMLNDLERPPRHIREVVAEAVVDEVRETFSKTIDLESAMTGPIEIAEGLRMIADRAESESGSRRYVTITLRFIVSEEAWIRRDHPIVLQASLLNAGHEVVDNASSSGQTHSRGFQANYRVLLRENDPPPDQVRLMLAPAIERRRLKLVGRNLPVP